MEGVATPEKSEADNQELELPAPQGWKKKLSPKKGSAGKRNEIVFISPTGEKIRNQKQLEQYFKAHPGGPSLSEFDWGIGEAPRRSSRIGEKVKATESPEGDPDPEKKRKKKSSSTEETKEVDGDGETEAPAAEMLKTDGGNKVEGVTTEVVGTKEAEEKLESQEKEKSDGGQAGESNVVPPLAETEEGEVLPEKTTHKDIQEQ